MTLRPERVVIDKRTVAEATDYFSLIVPPFYSVSIYDGAQRYEDDLIPFSQPQRLALAVHWYVAEVTNGGHDQFFDNSTGIVCADAIVGLRTIGAVAHAQVLESAVGMIGGSVSLDREERQETLERLMPDFGSLDEALFALEEGESVETRLLAYIKAHSSSFVFEGDVEMPA